MDAPSHEKRQLWKSCINTVSAPPYHNFSKNFLCILHILGGSQLAPAFCLNPGGADDGEKLEVAKVSIFLDKLDQKKCIWSHLIFKKFPAT